MNHSPLLEILQDSQLNCKRNIEARSSAHCCSRKAMSMTNSECASVALGIQHAMRMRPIILSSAACLVLQIVSTLLQIQQDFREKFY